MQKAFEHYNAMVSVWDKTLRVNEDQKFELENATEVVQSIFNPGKHYYFILNFFDYQIEYTSSGVKEILGCAPEAFTLESLMSRMHPDDVAQIPFKERAAVEFLYQRISKEKIPFYKSSYTFRVIDKNDGWKNIMHQSITLQVTTEGLIQRVLCVHTDVSFLTMLPDRRISFIGIKGEPSFYALSTNPESILEPADDGLVISNRERDIVLLLAEGLSSKQIADRLFISKNTVDTHRRNLIRRTGVGNTMELAIKLVKEGKL